MTKSKDQKPEWLHVSLDPKLHEELTLIARQVGFKDLEEMIQNYLREVALAARTELATLETRRAVLTDAGDLDGLKPSSIQKS